MVHPYSVIVTNVPGNPYPEKRLTFPEEDQAVEQARQWAKAYPNKQVYIMFFRESDGQEGYINPDGAGITGKSWTNPE